MKSPRLAIALLVVGAVAAGAIAAMFWTRHSALADLERQVAEATVGGGAPSPSGAEPVLQLPKIVGHLEREGVVVTLSNDASDRLVVIDCNEDRLVVEYQSSPDSPIVRHVPVAARTLAPGEATAPVFIPLEGRRESVKVRFEKRDRYGVYSTEVKIP